MKEKERGMKGNRMEDRGIQQTALLKIFHERKTIQRMKITFMLSLASSACKAAKTFKTLKLKAMICCLVENKRIASLNSTVLFSKSNLLSHSSSLRSVTELS